MKSAADNNPIRAGLWGDSEKPTADMTQTLEAEIEAVGRSRRKWVDRALLAEKALSKELDENHNQGCAIKALREQLDRSEEHRDRLCEERNAARNEIDDLHVEIAKRKDDEQKLAEEVARLTKERDEARDAANALASQPEAALKALGGAVPFKKTPEAQSYAKMVLEAAKRVEEIAERAAPMDPCPCCNGKGRSKGGNMLCLDCGGSGRRNPDLWPETLREVLDAEARHTEASPVTVTNPAGVIPPSVVQAVREALSEALCVCGHAKKDHPFDDVGDGLPWCDKCLECEGYAGYADERIHFDPSAGNLSVMVCGLDRKAFTAPDRFTATVSRVTCKECKARSLDRCRICSDPLTVVDRANRRTIHVSCSPPSLVKQGLKVEEKGKASP